MKYRHQNLYGV